MHIILFLVGLAFLAVQCRSQPITENDRQYPAIASQYQRIDQENQRQERQLQQLSRRPERRIPQDYRYQYGPEPNYSAETQYQPSYSETPNRIISRPRQLKQQPSVEQYLKEVTPTTKTTYDPSNYQPASTAPAQSAIEYFLHPEQQKKAIGNNQQRPFIQHERYQLPESQKETAVPQNVLAYQNALIAHQNAIYEQQRADQLQKQQQDSASKSSIYVSQNIQKKQAIKKLVKPKTSSLDDEIDYLTSLQYQQQQIQQQQQNKVYEAKQPPPVKYQARIPQYSKPELLATEEEQAQAYQPQIQYSAATRFAKPSKQPKQQTYQPEYQQEIRYQPLGDTEHTKFQQFDPAQYEQYIQYQSQPQIQPQVQPQVQPQAHPQPQPQPQAQPIYNAGPKYLPEQKLVRYQEPVAAKYQQQTELPTEDALQKYRASIAKFYSTDSSKASGPRQQVRPQYVQEEQPQQRYQAQQYEQPAQHQPQQQQQQQSQPIYQGPSEEEYKQSEFKHSLGLNSSLRVLKSGKPVVFVGHEE